MLHILGDTIGLNNGNEDFNQGYRSMAVWDEIERTLSRELGVVSLGSSPRNPYTNCAEFLLKSSVAHALDLIELSFKYVDTYVRTYVERRRDYVANRLRQSPDSAIEELNHRFREHAIGYEFADGQLVRKDSQFLHAEAVKPALTLLADAKFAGASAEFLSAFEHARHGRNKEAIADANKAFESTLKTICNARGWKFDPKDTAKRLVNVVIANGLLPTFQQEHQRALANVLESGLPTVRNKLAGHGQGDVPIEVPDFLVSYALHLAATNIVMLVSAHKARK